MKNLIAMAILAIIWLLGYFLLPIEAESEGLSVNLNTLSVQEMIEEIAPRFGQNPSLISKISWCESRHKIASHDGGRGVNITGFHDTTFNYWLPAYEKEQGETLDKESSYDQLKLMSWAFSKGEKYRWHWTTYRAYSNGGEYTFYSKLLRKTITSRCK